MKMFRPWIAAFLAALIIVTSQGMAYARGQTMAVGQIVLCTGHGPTVINIDKDGREVVAQHLCPDCALATLADVPAADMSVAPVTFGSALLGAVDHSSTLQAYALRPTARGPPVFL